MRKVHMATALTAAALIGSLAACSGGSRAPQPAAASSASTAAGSSGTAATGAKIMISSFMFMPHLVVKPGQTITVVNRDSSPHTVTATSGHTFDTGTIGGGKTATFTAPTKPGDYPYICTIHQFMHGTLTVR